MGGGRRGTVWLVMGLIADGVDGFGRDAIGWITVRDGGADGRYGREGVRDGD